MTLTQSNSLVKFGGVATKEGDLQPSNVVVVGQIQSSNGETIDFGNGVTFNGVSSRHFGFAAFYNDGVAQWATLGGGATVEFGDRSTAVTYGDDVYVAFQTQDSNSVFSLSSGGCAPVAFNGESLVVARLSATTGACVWLHSTSASDNILGYVAHRLS